MRNYSMNSYPVPLPAVLLLLSVLIYTVACAPAPRTDANRQASTEASDGRPEITEEKIRENIIGRTVENVLEENNASRPIAWSFEPDEPKEFTVLEKQMNGDRATIVIDMKTRSAPGASNPRQLSGKLKLQYILQTELVLRKWRIVEVENISMKYRNEPKKEAEKETEANKSK